MKINLFYLVPSLRKCGPTNQLTYLIKELSKSKIINITLIIISDKNLSKSIHLDLSKNQKIKIIFLKSYFHFIRLINSNKNTVIHSQGLIADLYAFSTFRYKRWILTSRNNPIKDYPSKFGFVKGYFISFIHLFIQLICKNVISCSYSLKNELKSLFIKSKTIQNSCYINKKISFNYELRNKFIYVGSLNSRKNIKILCKIFSKMKEMSLDIVGKGNKYYRYQYEKCENINFLGHKSAPFKNIKEYGFHISLSKSEGLPNSVLEAMSYGLPSILSEINPHKEISKNLTFNNLIDLNQRLDEIINSIKIKVKNYNESYIKSTYDSFILDFRAENMSKKYLEVYKKLSNEF